MEEVMKHANAQQPRLPLGETIMKSTAIAVVAALCSCAPPPPPARSVASSVASPNASFASYHSFSFGPANNPPPSYQVTPRSLEVQRRLHAVVLSTLQKQ